MWKDSETEYDYLNFDYLVNAVETIAMDEKLSPSTIGVYGDWGSGKSSLMQMVEQSIKDHYKENVACIRFNGWLMEGYEDAKTTFCGTILDELKEQETLPAKAKEKIIGLLQKIDGKKILLKGGAVALDLLLTGGIGSLSTLTIESIVSSLKTKIGDVNANDIKEALKDIKADDKKREDIKNFQKEFENILKESKITHLVVFIDELDRCKPETVLDIFEAMRLFLFVKGTSFIIGADSRLIDYAIKSRYKNIPGNNLDISTEYLEKLIQYPVTIPQLDSSELSRYMTCLLLEATITNIADIIKGTDPLGNITLDNLKGSYTEQDEEKIKEALALSSQLSPILSAKQNGNPRQCKRFLNTLFMRIAMAKTKKVELKTNVLAKLMLLEYFKPTMYVAVVDPKNKEYLKNFENGKCAEDNEFKKWENDEWVKGWNSISVKLSTEELKPYYYFSRGAQRVDLAIKEMISPQANLCLENLLGNTDTTLEKGIELFDTLADTEQVLVTERICEEMMRGDEIGTDIFKAYVGVIQTTQMLPNACEYIKKIPCGRYNKGLIGQMTSLFGKLSTTQKEDIELYLKQNTEIAKSIDMVKNILNKAKKK